MIIVSWAGSDTSATNENLGTRFMLRAQLIEMYQSVNYHWKRFRCKSFDILLLKINDHGL